MQLRKAWLPSNFCTFKMYALRSHCYIKITNANNGWHFITKCSTFIQYFLLSLPTAWNLIIFNNGKVIQTFQHDHLRIEKWKMFVQKPIIMQKLHEYQMISTKHQIVHSLRNAQCVYPRLQHKPSVLSATQHLPALAFHSW